VIGTARIVSTYYHVSQVYDEPFHVLRGMHWQTGHQYIHTEHPPLGPLGFALLPRLLGFQYSDTGSKLTDGNSILYENGEYLNTLVAFRVGNLLFFWIVSVLLYYWVSCRGSRWNAAIAVAFFTLCPTVLGHSGVATTDLPMTAMLLGTVVFVERAIWKPTNARWIVAGLATGLALLAKFSAMLFVPICFLVLFGLSPKSLRASDSKWKPLLNLTFFILALFATVWCIFGFSLGTLGSIRIKEYAFEGFPSSLSKLVVPFPEFIAGIVWAKSKLEMGHGDYFFGMTSEGGSLLFFPTVLAIKTPLAMLSLCLISCLACCRRISKHKSSWMDWPMLPLVISGALLAAVMPSSVNIGVRHLLPIYPFLSALAADGCQRAWAGLCKGQSCSMISRFGLGSLVVWLLVESSTSHPHYLSYFNGLVFGRPERIVVDSDLDWGQGVFELERKCRDMSINRLKVVYFGTAQLEKHQLPMEPSAEDTHYWIAISTTTLFRHPQFEEFRLREPDAVIPGGSMRLYRIGVQIND